MVDRLLIQQLGLTEEQLDQQISELYTSEHQQMLEKALDKKVEALVPGTIVKGKIVGTAGNEIVVELGLKSEGMIDATEFDSPDEVVPGKEIEVLLEEVDAENGLVLSKRKADRIRGWENITTTKKEGGNAHCASPAWPWPPR